MTDSITKALEQPITNPQDAFFDVTQSDTVTEESLGEVEIHIVELAQGLTYEAAQALHQAGLTDQASTIVNLLTALEAREHAIFPEE